MEPNIITNNIDNNNRENSLLKKEPVINLPEKMLTIMFFCVLEHCFVTPKLFPLLEKWTDPMFPGHRNYNLLSLAASSSF